MTIEILKRILLFAILCLVQVLVLNHIRLFACATPLLYVYFVLKMDRDSSRWGIMLWGLALGLTIDIFSNTPGLAAGTMTLLAFLQPALLSLFTQRETDDNLHPAMKTMGSGKFIYYTTLCVLLYCTVFFTLEAFNFFNLLQWVKNIIGSTILTTVLILCVENLNRK